MISTPSYVTVIILGVRLFLLLRLWRLPLKNGEGYFLSQPVKPGFYGDAGTALLRSWRVSLVVMFLLDSPLAVWFGVTGRQLPLLMEQIFAAVVTVVAYNILAAHFSLRATALAAPEEDRHPTAFQLSMSPRRLRDHTHIVVEAVLVAATMASFGLLWRDHVLSVAPGAGRAAAHAFRASLLGMVWMAYIQMGLLLLKGVLVRWRMPLPANRTEDFRRWRAAWLNHNLNVFDAVRVLCAVSLLGGIVWRTYGELLPAFAYYIAGGVWILMFVVYFAYIMVQGRRLAAMQRELKPIEMVKEFPRSPIAEGRYLAGGLLYFNRDNPRVIVRSAQGLAFNLGHPSLYIWLVYFLGLAAVMTWVAR
jgi:hypothetical protein